MTEHILSYADFRKKHPATRFFHRYTHEQRADHASSSRLGHRQRGATGEFFYTHPLVPDVGFSTAKMATTKAYAVYLETLALMLVLAELDA